MDPDEYARALAVDMMLDSARSVSRLDVRNAAGGHDAVADLDDAGYEAFLDQVLELIETADIDIEVR
jgi:predicted ABC-type ATPase